MRESNKRRDHECWEVGAPRHRILRYRRRMHPRGLADGMLDGDVIECCMHMGSFHVPTGNVVAPPCEVPLRTYKVVLEGDDVFADLAQNAAGEANG